MADLEKTPKKTPNYPFLDSKKKKLKYSCEVCDFESSNKKDFNRHILTPKHDSKWIVHFSGKITDSELKNKHFSCDECKHITCDLSDFEAHKMEHKKTPKKTPNYENQNRPSIPKKKNKYICEFCDRSYKYDTGYYKHVKKCLGKSMSQNKLLDLVVETQTQLLESQEQTRELCNEIIKLKDTSKIINNNTYNQSVNINLFLNEECKNAMNLTDFINKVQMTLTDLAYTTNNGMIKGMTNIVIKNLEDTPPTKRPIHSIQDKDGSQLYIKEDDTWGCKNKKENLEKTITSISKKQCGLIKEWEKHHPDWNKSEEETSQYMEICRIIMGGTTDMELEKTRDLILKSIPVTDVSTVENN